MDSFMVVLPWSSIFSGSMNLQFTRNADSSSNEEFVSRISRPQARILGHDNVATGPITPQYCAQLCANGKFALAGTEFGSECYCGNKLNTQTPQKAQNCSKVCNGDGKQKCGGFWSIAVFEVKCSGAPEPPPSGPPKLVNPCLGATKFSKMPFCNASLPIDERVADAVKRMTLQEKSLGHAIKGSSFVMDLLEGVKSQNNCGDRLPTKEVIDTPLQTDSADPRIGALGTSTPAIASLGLPSYNWWSEASSGVKDAGNLGGRSPTLCPCLALSIDLLVRMYVLCCFVLFRVH